MNVSRTPHSAGYTVFTVEQGDDQYQVSEFGGQLLSWKSKGKLVLFDNASHAVVDGVKPYRGGAPICFPYFGKGTLLPGGNILQPQHGLARVSTWASRLTDTDLTLTTEVPSAGEFASALFRCTLTYSFKDGIEVGVLIENIGSTPAPFQFVLHSYWSCDHPSDARVEGLGDPYLDNFLSYAQSDDSASSEPHELPVDRVYFKPDSLIEIDGRVAIQVEGFNSAVLWNPGTDHGIADLGSTDFLCVESGIISPAPWLNAGESYEAAVHFKLNYK